MQRYATVDEYIIGHEQHQDILIQLRDLCKAEDVEETVKWGAPAYTCNGKTIIGIGAFKSYIGLWFHQGALLEDKSKVLINAQKGVTKALRQWRFNNADEIDAALVSAYIREAIQNQKEGKEIKPAKKKPLVVPDELKAAFKANEQLNAAFTELSLTKQREYADYISSAKRQETKESRLDKIRLMILDGIGLHDKYRK